MQCEVRWSNETGGGLVKPYPHHISKYGQQSAWKDKIMDDEARRERRRRQRQKMLNCCKKFAAFLFSHIGLAAMVVAYSIMGGFLFMALEAPYEAKEKIRIRGERDDAIERILNEASQMKLDDAAVVGNFTAKVRTILLAYQAEVVSAVKDSGWDGNDDTDVRALQWSFAGALLYAVTVITTIGYGHVAPKTEWGRLVTILYALIGIPLTFLYLSNIGNFLANSFRLFYKKVCCDIFCCQQCERKKKMQRLRLRRQREQLAAQRNLSLTSPPHPLQYGTHDETLPIPTPNQSEYYIEAEQFGLPGGDENLGFEDDVDSEGEIQVEPNDDSMTEYDKENETLLGKGASDEIRETDILDDDFMKYTENVRETDILDDDLDPPSRKPSKKKATSPSSDIHVSSGILDKLGDARETDILNDSEDENNDDNGHYDDMDCNNEPKLPDGRLKNEGSTKKCRAGSKKSRWLRDRTKKGDKDTKDKKDRTKNVDATKEHSKSFKKDKDREAKKERTLSSNKDLKRQGSTRAAAGEAADPYTSHSRSDSKKGKACATETNKSTRSSRKFLRKGSDKNKKRDSAQTAANPSQHLLRRKSSKKLKKSSSSSEDEEGDDEDEVKIQNKAFHHSEESFVTAQGDSLSYVEKLNSEPGSDVDVDDDAAIEDRFHAGRVPKSAIAPDITIDDDDDFAIELMEYGELGPGHGRFADDPFEYEGHADDEKVTVPISICLIIIAGYIFAGSVLFTVWEEWDYLTGSYFCFITLSTIGFGDIVPGTDMKEWSSHSKLVSCSLWLAFGLSLLAMCFNLMQEEVKEKCKWLGKKLGLLKDENEA